MGNKGSRLHTLHFVGATALIAHPVPPPMQLLSVISIRTVDATLFLGHFGPINWLNQMGELPVQHNKINITTNDNDNARTRKKKSSLLIKLAWVLL